MTGTFEVVVIVVCILAAALSFTRFFQPFSVLRKTGHDESTPTIHPQDYEPGGVDAPQSDSPLLHRRLRGRTD